MIKKATLRWVIVSSRRSVVGSQSENTADRNKGEALHEFCHLPRRASLPCFFCAMFRAAPPKIERLEDANESAVQKSWQLSRQLSYWYLLFWQLFNSFLLVFQPCRLVSLVVHCTRNLFARGLVIVSQTNLDFDWWSSWETITKVDQGPFTEFVSNRRTQTLFLRSFICVTRLERHYLGHRC